MSEHTIKRLGPADLGAMDQLMDVFGSAFGDVKTYGANRPSVAYLKTLLSERTFIALVALQADRVVGGLVAYELRKFEQERSELYVYDLAVDEGYRRRGIARTLLREVKVIAADLGAYVVMVQADYGDEPAIDLYSSLGTREEVLHFDLPVDESR